MIAQPLQKQRSPRQLMSRIASTPEQIEQAQRLRFRVFSEEYGADLGADANGRDQDAFDPWCDHMLVIDEATGELAATTRILHQRQAVQAGGFYSEGEFDLANLHQLPGNVAELGRTCVHPDYRNGATLALLWAELARYLVTQRVDYLIGCASISMADGGHKAWRIARQLQQKHLCEESCRVTPLRALPHLANLPEDASATVTVPPLIRTYMRLGAKVCGEPCWDPDFRCADLLVLLEVSDLSARYSRHFLNRGDQ
ncbi:MAG: GNAT family N-acyltransferase [Pseudomonadota bacterium]|nr:GNAT family N-acyltransferase [Pseudomonadota bacterium]